MNHIIFSRCHILFSQKLPHVIQIHLINLMEDVSNREGLSEPAGGATVKNLLKSDETSKRSILWTGAGESEKEKQGKYNCIGTKHASKYGHSHQPCVEH